MPRTTWTYTIGQKQTLKLSRSRLELFRECSRCFWLLLRHNIKRPSMPGFTLNQAVDHLLKKEFDIYRSQAKPHPLMAKHKLSAVPYKHEKLDDWRDSFKGLEYLNEGYNFLIFGGIDDVWINEDEELLIVDYKSTARDEPVVELYETPSYHDSYRRQLEIYQWLLAKNGFKVSPKAYIVYATGLRSKDRFSNKISFSLNLIEHQGQTDWIEPLIDDAYACLQADIPSLKKSSNKDTQFDCEHCNYVWQRMSYRQLAIKKKE